MVKNISDNEIYLLIKYIKSIIWRVAKCLSYIEEARCLKVNILRASVQDLILLLKTTVENYFQNNFNFSQCPFLIPTILIHTLTLWIMAM